MQIETLRAHGMSPAEFIWIEDLAYVTWAGKIEEVIGDSAGRREAPGDHDRGQGGSSPNSNAGSGHHERPRSSEPLLDERLQTLENPDPPAVEGVSDETSALFWNHREELDDLDLARYSELHDILRGNNDVNIQIDGHADEE